MVGSFFSDFPKDPDEATAVGAVAEDEDEDHFPDEELPKQDPDPCVDEKTFQYRYAPISPTTIKAWADRLAMRQLTHGCRKCLVP